MRFCEVHWNALKEAIKSRGLEPLVSENLDSAVTKILDSQSNGYTPENFDPLLCAQNLIMLNAFEYLGPLMIVMGCPLCALNKQHKEACDNPDCHFEYEVWIDASADHAAKVLEQTMKGTA